MVVSIEKKRCHGDTRLWLYYHKKLRFPADSLQNIEKLLTTNRKPQKIKLLNYCSIGYYRPFFYNHNTILNSIGTVITIFELFATIYLYIVTYIGVFINDRIFDMAPVADTHNR